MVNRFKQNTHPAVIKSHSPADYGHSPNQNKINVTGKIILLQDKK